MSIVNDHELISATWLEQRLRSPDVRIFDCTVHLRPDPKRTYRVESGHGDYQAAHIPGAAFLDLAGSLSDPSSRLAFTLPPPERLAAALAEAGVDDSVHTVLYSASHPMWATRVWWMLRALGVDRVGVLDGGLAAWRGAGCEIAAGDEQHPPGQIRLQWRPEMWADRTRVREEIGSDTTCTVNALPPAVYRGEGDVNYGRRGHITGSVNVPYAALFDEHSGCFRDAETLRAAFTEVGAFDRAVICYCGGGISATCDAFALTRLGHDRVAVYDGSMADWVRDPELPMTAGETPGAL